MLHATEVVQASDREKLVLINKLYCRTSAKVFMLNVDLR